MKPLTIDQIVLRFSQDVLEYLKSWMNTHNADDIDYHRYRMRLLYSLNEANSTSEKLIMLMDKVGTKIKFDILENISDKVMGESVAKYIFSKLMIHLNEQHRKILEHELDRVRAETSVLLEKASGLHGKIGQH